MSRTLIAPALRHALACKGHSVRALGQTLSDFLGNVKVLDILLSSRGVDGRGHKKNAKTDPILVFGFFPRLSQAGMERKFVNGFRHMRLSSFFLELLCGFPPTP